MKHAAFAERAGRRLEKATDRLEGEGRRLGIDGEASKTTARARELRTAALLVRGEAAAVGHEERREPRRRRSPKARPWRRRASCFRREAGRHGLRAERGAKREAAKCP